jgi:acetyl-CoA carboxylase carboxyltransferase component
MGGEQAAKTLLQIQVSGKEVSEAEQNNLLNKIKSRYEKQTSPYYAAARLWVDDIIDPSQTRLYISEGIAGANHNADINDLKLGVFQV